MELLLIPLALFIAGIFLYINYKKVKKQYDNISSVERSSVSEIQENHDHFLVEFGTGTYQHYVEIYGTVKSGTPITSPVAGKPCVWVDYKIERNYETTVQERDSQGRVVTRMENHTEVLSSNMQFIPFIIEDGGLEIEVLPDSAEVFPVQSYHSRTAYLDPGLAGKLGISTGYRGGTTTGFTVNENIIPTGQQLYVLGEANDRTGKLAISKPRDKEQSFILSTTHEDVLLQKLSVKVKWFGIGFRAALIAGILVLAYLVYYLYTTSLPG
jgi:hypothetical protein